MRINHNIIDRTTKTLGPSEARLWVQLSQDNRKTFNIRDVSTITGLKGHSLRKFIYRLRKKGLVTRLRSGLYNMVPFEMGQETHYFGNPYIVAREIVNLKSPRKPSPYYLSHASAMDFHQMVTQPQLVVYASTILHIKPHTIMGTMFHFVTCKPSHMFGMKKYWIDNTNQVWVSDLEKTIIDGLKMPQYCGGITEVAKGFWMKRKELDLAKMINYAEQLNLGVVYRRLGFLLETYEMNAPNEIDRLQKRLSKTYHLLDPTLLNEGKYNSRWRLRMNISKEEFLAVVRT